MDDIFFKGILDNLSDGVYLVDAERRITYWNRGAERLTGYTAAEVVGRRCADRVLKRVDCQARCLCGEDTCPAAAVIRDGKLREKQVFLHHKDGYKLPVMTRVTPMHDDSGAIVGAVEVFSDNTSAVAASAQIERLKTAALLDPLAGLGNRRFGEHALATKLEERRRYGWSVGALFVDVDHFKTVNDGHGHAVGDRALRMVAGTLNANLRSFDTVCRWGGEEFLALLSNIVPQHLQERADSLRCLVAESELCVGGTAVAVTVSIGATMARDDDTPESLVARADRLMYESKRAGRDTVTVG